MHESFFSLDRGRATNFFVVLLGADETKLCLLVAWVCALWWDTFFKELENMFVAHGMFWLFLIVSFWEVKEFAWILNLLLWLLVCIVSLIGFSAGLMVVSDWLLMLLTFYCLDLSFGADWKVTKAFLSKHRNKFVRVKGIK